MNWHYLKSFRYVFMLLCISYIFTFFVKKTPDIDIEEAKVVTDPVFIRYLWYTTVNESIPDDTSCYDVTGEDDGLEDIREKVVLHDSIFFHETSCSRNMPMRRACAVESAARFHSGRQVIVLFTKSLSEEECTRGPLEDLYRLQNVNFARVNLSNYAFGTPLENVFKENLTNHGLRHHSRVAEYLKFLTLYRFGGTVVDLDMMVMPLLGSLLPYWLVEEDKKLGSGVISIAKERLGENLTYQFLSVLAKQATSGELDSGRAMYEVLERHCNTSDIRQMTFTKCGVHVYSSDMFYPVNESTWQDYLKPIKNLNVKYAGYHIRNSENINTTIPKDSLYARIAEVYCPILFSNYIHEFIEKGS